MPLILDANRLKRLRGRPSAADRAFEDLFHAKRLELFGDSPEPVEIDPRFVPGTKRHRRGPPAVTGRTARYIAAIAAGAHDEAARVAAGLQRRAVRRLLATSRPFQTALADARRAALANAAPQCGAGDAGTAQGAP